MIGSIIAILFSLKILILQRAKESTTAGYFLTVEKTGWQNVIFFTLTFTVVLFSVLSWTLSSFQVNIFGFNIDLLKTALQVSFFIVGLDLFLVFQLVEEQRNKVNPFVVLNEIQESSINYLDEIYRKATQYSNLVMMHPKTDQHLERGQVLASTFQAMKKDIGYLSVRLNYLFDYHDKVLAENDRIAAFKILEVIAKIIEKYFQIRKDSSILLPSGFFFVSSSDSKEFLSPIVEHLLTIGENYLKKEDAEGVRKISSLFQDLVIHSSEIKYVGSSRPDSPILDQFFGYLNHFMGSVIDKGFMEGMYKGALVYRDIGICVIQKNLHVQVFGIYEMLEKIAIKSLERNYRVVFIEVSNTFSQLIAYLFTEKWFINHILSRLLQHLQKITVLGYHFASLRSTEDIRFQQEIVRPYETLAEMIRREAIRVPLIKSRRKKDEAKANIIKTVKELYFSIRYISENVKNSDSILIGSFAILINRVGSLLINLTSNKHWVDAKTALERESGGYLYLPEWFISNATSIDTGSSFDELPEAVSKMGLEALGSNQDGLADDAIKIINGFATSVLSKENPSHHGHTEPRIMLLACYLGIYALKLGKTSIITKLKTLISAFEQAYVGKYFVDPRADLLSSPRREQLTLEVIQYMESLTDLNRVDDFMPNTGDLLRKKIVASDVKKFLHEVWGIDEIH